MVNIDKPDGVSVATKETDQPPLENDRIMHKQYALTIKADASATSGRTGVQAPATTLTFDDGETASVTLVWRRNAPILVMPPFAHFGFVADGETKTTSIVLRARKGSEFAIESA